MFVPETIILKLLRLCLGELGQSIFDSIRLEDEFPMDEALKRMLGTEDTILTKNYQPLHETAADLFYRHELKDLHRSIAPRPESTILRLLIR